MNNMPFQMLQISYFYDRKYEKMKHNKTKLCTTLILGHRDFQWHLSEILMFKTNDYIKEEEIMNKLVI